jgi:fatty-acyl-CoA synthase
MVGAVDHVGLHARLTPDRLAARDLTSGRSFTYHELDRAVGRFAAALAGRGIGEGERVAMLAKNRIDCVLLHLAVARLGAIYVPLNWRLSAAEIAALLADAAPKLFLGDGCLAEAGLAGIPMEEFAAEAEKLAPRPESPLDPERPSLILYTSGTSGRAKGALLSERNLEHTAINFSLLGRVTPDSVFLCDAPMFHVIGIVTNIRPVLMQGGAFMVSDGFVPARTLQRLADPALKVTHYFCVPQMAAALKADPAFRPEMLKGLTAIFTGGAPHPGPVIRAWLADGIAVVDGYGMSEAGTVFGMPLDPRLIDARAGSVGLAAPALKCRVVDGAGADCPPGEAGELLLKGGNITSGYWRRPEESRVSFTDDGWFRTGDIVRADHDGYYWVVDRAKDMFISGGENVYPAEIEAALAGHPAIKECAVVGVPDEQWGEVGHLFLVATSPLDGDALLAELRQRLARYKVPKYVSFLDALPRNGAGKVLKRQLREQVGAGKG